MEKKFKLHNYPYLYKCPKCGYEFELTEEREAYWKDGYGIFSEDPLAFECKECRFIAIKPVGYVTPPKFENFKVFMPPTKEEIALYDELFGPLDEEIDDDDFQYP